MKVVEHEIEKHLSYENEMIEHHDSKYQLSEQT